MNEREERSARVLTGDRPTRALHLGQYDGTFEVTRSYSGAAAWRPKEVQLGWDELYPYADRRADRGAAAHEAQYGRSSAFKARAALNTLRDSWRR